MSRIQAIKEFLLQHGTERDLNALFNEEMETQVNVAQDHGIKVEKEYNNRKWWGWQAEAGKECHWEGEIWKPFRIPRNANKPGAAEYTDRRLNYSTDHFEAIGLTGWNWVRKESWWVGFDFDNIINHSAGLSEEDLTNVRRAIEQVPWVQVRRSTSGKGFHFYVFLNPSPSTNSHTEHAALARAILGIISARVGQRLESKVDVVGGVLWIWHRKQGVDGYSLVKEANEPLAEVPNNWRDHIDVVNGRRKRIRNPVEPTNSGVGTTEWRVDATNLESLLDKTKISPLDDDHRALLGWLAAEKCLWWWDSDRQLLVAHTYDLAMAHKAMMLKGVFYTNATGKDKGNDQNCFCFPLRNGGWAVRRHTRRASEHASWSTDSSGWTRCYLNVPADINTVARCHGGVERSDGRYEIPSLMAAIKAVEEIGAPPFKEEEIVIIKNRPAQLKQHKDGRAIISVARNDTDTQPEGWATSKDKNYWEKIVPIEGQQPEEIEVPDDQVRHVVFDTHADGWFINIRGKWICDNDNNVKRSLIALGRDARSLQELLGHCVNNPWFIVNRPFQPEYPGNRQWNRDAPQFAFEPLSPSRLDESLGNNCSNWHKILEHCGKGLDEAVTNNKWCYNAGITTGAQYLLYWIASVFQYPTEPLPYLFFYGPQNSGKSILHEALSLLLKNKIGYTNADLALTSNNKFNHELLNCVLAIVEETHLGANEIAYARIKEWVTAKTLLIHIKHKSPYTVPNYTHWIQCANDIDACPIFPGDTRITMTHVPLLTDLIPKQRLLHSLEVEAPTFLGYILSLQIPVTEERLRIPVVISADKAEALSLRESAVIVFLRQYLYPCIGASVEVRKIYESFISWLPIENRKRWAAEHKFYGSIPPDLDGVPLVKGKHKTNFLSIANVTLDPDLKGRTIGRRLTRVFDKLVEA